MRWFLVALPLLLVACKDSDHDGAPDRVDCADADPLVHPDQPEVCNGLDDDCDGNVDEDVAIVAYWDRDADGWGDAGHARRVCQMPADGVSVDGDCDDTDPLTHPEAAEICDEVDNDCDAEVDEGATPRIFFVDADDDGHGAATATAEGCSAPPGYVDADDDCDDGDPTTYDGAPEVCDARDNDCDGDADEDLELVPSWTDADGDGHGDEDATLAVYACGAEAGRSADRLDCDDANVAIGPDATEIVGNATDEDCDGWLDEFGVPTPYATVQDALAAAPDGSIVQFDAGTYFGTVDLTGRDVVLAGEGCGRTILYGDQLGSTVTMTGGTVADLAIEGGTGTFIGPAKTDGGGLLVQGDVLAERVCVRNNSASRRGGGIGVISGTLTLRESVVSENTATQHGGGIYVNAGASLVLRDTVVSDNLALEQAGGGINTQGGTLDLASCVVAGNGAGTQGGGVAVQADTTAVGDFVTFLARGAGTIGNCTFHGNESVTRGSAIANYASDLTVTGSIFTDHAVPLAVVDDVNGVTNDGTGAYVLVEEAFTTLSTSSFLGNTGTDQLDGWILDALRIDPAYVLVDANASPESWDFHLRAGSAAIDAADALLTDPDGSRADLGGFGGPDANPDASASYTTDTDGDGMLDGDELRWGLWQFAPDATLDPDADGLTHLEEISAGTDPFTADTDADGVADAAERTAGSDPTLARDHRPVADAGQDRWVWVGQVASLDGSASWDPNGDGLTWAWTVVDAPIGSAVAGLSSPTTATPTFTPDLSGPYTLSLVVDDGGASHEDVVVVNAGSGLVVPDDHPTVQAAIDASLSGASVGVRPGTWVGALDLGGKDLAIIGLGDRAEVVLDAAARGPVVTADAGQELTLAHLTLTHGWANEGGGVYAPGIGELTLVDVAVIDNLAGTRGGGVHATEGTAQIDGAVFQRNEAPDGGALSVSDLDLSVTRSTFIANAAGAGAVARVRTLLGAGENGGLYTFESCAFQENVATEAAILSQSGGLNEVHFRQSVVAGNTGSSLFYSTGYDTFVMGSVLTGNQVTFAFDGPDADPNFQPLADVRWGDAGELYFAEVGLPATLELFLEADPDLATWTRDGDPSDDALYSGPASALIDASFPDWLDLDGSRADIGPAGGPSATGASLRFAADLDADTLGDGWEIRFGLDPSTDDAASDLDADGLSNLEERQLGTDPTDPDSDEDGLGDAVEAAGAGDPADASDHRPRADAGAPSFPLPGQEAVLDGSASIDPDGGELTWRWRFVGVPEASSLTDADLLGSDGPIARFVPDVEGAYLLGLEVSDGVVASVEDLVIATKGRSLLVPEDYPTVEDALVAASAGDVVQLAAGSWDLALDDLPVAVTIAGAGVDETYLQGTGTAAIANIGTGEALALADLTLAGSSNSTGGAVVCNGGTLDMLRVRAEFNVARFGGAMHLTDCTTTLTDVDLVDNDSSDDGGAIYVVLGALTWTRGELARNLTTGDGGGIYASDAAVALEGVVMHHNEALLTGGAVRQIGGTVTAEHLTVAANDGSWGALYLDDGSSVRHSVLQQNGAFGLYLADPLEVVVSEFNGFFGNLSGAASPVVLSVGPEHVLADARFVALDVFGPGVLDDLHLRQDSPMIDAGADALDPDGTLEDLGAYGGPQAAPGFDAFYQDGDADGLADGWELETGLDPAVPNGALDPDGDGWDNVTEQANGTDPLAYDTDGDGVSDAAEGGGGTDPLDGSASKPFADAGVDVTVDLGEPAPLDGSGSSDPNGDALTYAWTLVEKPGRSALTTADLVGADTASPQLTPDVPGAYDLALVVSAAGLVSDQDTVRLTARGDVLVPEDYASIAEAHEAVAEGWVVVVGPGTWPMRLEPDGKAVWVVGAGEDLTTLDAEGQGQHIWARDGEAVTLQGLTLTGGLASQGGALRLDTGSDVFLADVSLVDNIGIYGGAGWLRGCTLTAIGVHATDNLGLRYGGALYLTDTDATLERSLLAGNVADVLDGGAIYLLRGSLTLVNVILSDNEASGKGGALSITGDSAGPPVITLDHVTATFNSAPLGAFAYLVQAAASVTNSIVADHTSAGAVARSLTGTVAYSQAYSLFGGNTVADYVDFDAATVPTAATGNLFAPAEFVGASDDGDWTNDDWGLSATSPALDAADPASPADPDGTAPDMGALGGASGDWVP